MSIKLTAPLSDIHSSIITARRAAAAHRLLVFFVLLLFLFLDVTFAAATTTTKTGGAAKASLLPEKSNTLRRSAALVGSIGGGGDSFVGTTTTEATGEEAGAAAVVDETQSSSSGTSGKEGGNDDDDDDDDGSSPSSASSSSGGREALVICAVDGTVYTVDAWAGTLRGLFGSGGPLVGSSSIEEGGGTKLDEEDFEDDDDDDDVVAGQKEEEFDDECEDDGGKDEQASRSRRRKEKEEEALVPSSVPNRRRKNREDRPGSSGSSMMRVVPGLDGRIYTLQEEEADEEGNTGGGGGRLDVLPVSVMEVAYNPVSTCGTNDDNDDEDEMMEEEHDQEEGGEEDDEDDGCGLLTGTKSATIFAMDPNTGTIRWMRGGGDHDTLSQGGHLDPTKESPNKRGGRKNKGGRKRRYNRSDNSQRTVLLQREDYVVRHIDVLTGHESWNVTVGQFSALDFPTTSTSSRRRGGGGGPAGGGAAATTRAASAASASLSSTGNNGGGGGGGNGVPRLPLHRGNGRKSTEDNEEEKGAGGGGNEESFFAAFPSIAFGEDGTTISAVDVVTGTLLWRRKIESVVAAVYGVGRESRWVSLDVIDEEEIYRHANNALLVAEAAASRNKRGGDTTPFLFSHVGRGGATTTRTKGLWNAPPLLPSPYDVQEEKDMKSGATGGVGGAGAGVGGPGLTFSMFNSDKSVASKSSSSSLSGMSTSLVPYGSKTQSSPIDNFYIDPLADRIHIARLGQHSSTLFVASTSSSSAPPNLRQGQRHDDSNDNKLLEPPPPEEDIMQYPLLDSEDGSSNYFAKVSPVVSPLLPGVIEGDEEILWGFPYMPRTTQKTEHGLFLSWQMVSAIVSVLLASAVCGRMAYVRGKKRWMIQNMQQVVVVTAKSQKTPPLVPTNPNSADAAAAQRFDGLSSDNNSHEESLLPHVHRGGGGSRTTMLPSHLSLNGDNDNKSMPAAETDFGEEALNCTTTALLTHHLSGFDKSKKKITSSEMQQRLLSSIPLVRSMSLPAHLNTLRAKEDNVDAAAATAAAQDISMAESRVVAMNVTANDGRGGNKGVVESNKSIDSTAVVVVRQDLRGEKGLFGSSSSNQPGFRTTTVGTSTAALTSRNVTVKPGNNTTTSSSLAPPTKNIPLPQTTTITTQPRAVGSINGIPLVRYSRYKSEFNELDPLGKGGFGTVFRCSNALDGRHYAVKKIFIHNSRVDKRGIITERFSLKLQRVLREVKILALLDHPNIVRYYTAWLELEHCDEDNVTGTGRIDEESSSALVTSSLDNRNRRLRRCYSSELLTGAAAGGGGGISSASSPSSWCRRPSENNKRSSTFGGATSSAGGYYGRRPSWSGRTKRKTTTTDSGMNPLGWNNFLSSGLGLGGGATKLDDVMGSSSANHSCDSQFFSEEGSRGSSWTVSKGGGGAGEGSLMRHQSSAASIDETDLGFNWDRSDDGGSGGDDDGKDEETADGTGAAAAAVVPAEEEGGASSSSVPKGSLQGESSVARGGLGRKPKLTHDVKVKRDSTNERANGRDDDNTSSTGSKGGDDSGSCESSSSSSEVDVSRSQAMMGSSTTRHNRSTTDGTTTTTTTTRGNAGPISGMTTVQSSLHSRPTTTTATSRSLVPTRQKQEIPPPANRGGGSTTTSQRHILYIQMQLCSQKTLADFLSNAEARRRGRSMSGENSWDNKPPTAATSSCPPSSANSSSSSSVDVPYALRMFSQIARGVKHVHRQGLIHRDLKPSNCFIDDAGVVKIGDFGLSRETSSSRETSAAGGGGDGAVDDDGIAVDDDEGEREDDINKEEQDRMEKKDNELGGKDNDNTVGVGTRSYASPEQMSGSDYDASTDVYSLGIILFELCYPMYTGMERHLVFNSIRKRVFPNQWHQTVAHSFPKLHDLLTTMLSPIPSERPSASDVAEQVDTQLGEYTVLSLDRTRRTAGSVLLRVEAVDAEGVLRRTIQTIKEAAPKVVVLQYGLRGQESNAIMEFALSVGNGEDVDEEGKKHDVVPCDEPDDDSDSSAVRRIIQSLNEKDEVVVVRQVTERGESGNMDVPNTG